jgi:hypothetical protein
MTKIEQMFLELESIAHRHTFLLSSLFQALSFPTPNPFSRMSFPSVSVFADLIATYPTWADLSQHLRSADGGNLTVYAVPNSDFAMIHYNREKSNFAVPHVRAFRSVVWNTAANRPVSVTPFKSESGEVLEFRSDPFPLLVPGANMTLAGAGASVALTVPLNHGPRCGGADGGAGGGCVSARLLSAQFPCEAVVVSAVGFGDMEDDQLT